MSGPDMPDSGSCTVAFVGVVPLGGVTRVRRSLCRFGKLGCGAGVRVQKLDRSGRLRAGCCVRIARDRGRWQRAHDPADHRRRRRCAEIRRRRRSGAVGGACRPRYAGGPHLGQLRSVGAEDDSGEGVSRPVDLEGGRGRDRRRLLGVPASAVGARERHRRAGGRVRVIPCASRSHLSGGAEVHRAERAERGVLLRAAVP